MTACPVCHRELPAGAAFCPHCGAALSGAPTYDDYAYEAFISYRHAPHDQKLARRIQRRIEGFAIPRELEGPRAGEKLGKCFRDEDELHTSDSLPALIEDALKRSRFLIVICSPAMRESPWVAREVELYAAYHGRQRILPVLAEGEPEDAFPPLLMTALEKNEDTGEMTERPCEPLAADMRDATRKSFRAELLRVVAPIAGCGYDDLRQRERLRRITRTAVAAGAAAVIAAGFGAFALYQQVQIERNYDAALLNQSQYLAEESQELLAQGDRMQAVQVALAALGESEGSRPYTPSARLALEQACEVYPGSYWRPVYANHLDEELSAWNLIYSADAGCYAVDTSNGTVHVYDLVTGEETCTVRDASTFLSATCFAGSKLVCAWGNDEAAVFDPRTGEELARAKLPVAEGASGYVGDIAAAPDGSLAALTWRGTNGETGEGVLITYLLDTATGEISAQQTFSYDESLDAYDYSLPHLFTAAFSSDGSTLVQSAGETLHVLDVARGAWKDVKTSEGVVTSLRFAGDALYAVAFDEKDRGSQFAISAYDPQGYERRWSFRLDASTPSITNDTSVPAIYGVTKRNEGTYLLVSYNQHVYFLSTKTGEAELDFEATGQVQAATCADEGKGGFAYVADGKPSTAFDPFGYREIGELGIAYSGNPPSAPNTYGGEPETGAWYADFVALQSGEQLCVTANPQTNSTSVWRYDLENACPGAEETDDKLAAAMDASFHAPQRSAEGTYVAVFDSTANEALIADGATFATERTLDLAALAPGESYFSVFLSPEDDEVLYLTAGNTLTAVSLATGEKLGSYESPAYSIEESGLAFRNGKLYAFEHYTDLSASTVGEIVEATELVALDPRTLEETDRLALAPAHEDEMSDADCVVLLDNMLVVSIAVYDDASTDASYALHTFDLASGKEVESEISGTVVGSAYSLSSLHASADGTRLAFATAGEVVLATSEGSILWRACLAEQGIAPELASNPFVAFTPEGNVVVQDTNGQLLLLSGQTGSTLATSQAADLDSIDDAWLSLDGTRLYARTSLGDLHTIALDPDLFGIESSVTGGTVTSSNERHVLVEDTYGSSVLPLYTTDELRSFAQELISGHELTEAEKRAYHID